MWEDFFTPVSNYVLAEDFNRSQYSSNIECYSEVSDFPDFNNQKFDIVLVGVGFDSFDLSTGITQTPDHVRYWFYRLFKGNYDVRIADLGNFNVKNSLDDVSEKLSDLLAEIIYQGSIPVIIGGGKEIAYANYLAYKKIGKYCNLLNVSSSLNFSEATNELTASNFLSKILADPENHLFNYCNIGYQTYLNAPELIELFRGFHFDLHRLGEVRANIEETEPFIRDVDFIAFDLGAVKFADAPHTLFGSPNGLSSDEICRLARYAGLSMKLSSIGFYGIQPGGKLEWPDHHLMAQVIWHFIEGFYLRKPESMRSDDPQYMKYHVTFDEYPDEIIFYKNTITEKWWMGVPVNEQSQGKYQMREYLIPCSPSDYQIAALNEVPDRWLRTFKKLND
jgi:arginase family enzyme